MVRYHDAERPEVRLEHAEALRRIEEQGLIYPVTLVDGEPIYDGAVSYPTILRALQKKLQSVS